MVSFEVTVGVGLTGVEGLVMAGEGEGGVGMGVVFDLSVVSEVLGVDGRLCVELDDVDTDSVVLDDGVSVVMGWKSGVPISVLWDTAVDIGGRLCVSVGMDGGFPVSVRLDGVSVVMG